MAEIICSNTAASNLRHIFGTVRRAAESQPPPVQRPCSVSQRLAIWREHELSLLARTLAILIIDRSALSDGCVMGADGMGELLGVTRPSITRALAELAKIGWLRTERRGRKHPARRSIDLG